MQTNHTMVLFITHLIQKHFFFLHSSITSCTLLIILKITVCNLNTHNTLMKKNNLLIVWVPISIFQLIAFTEIFFGKIPDKYF